MMYRVLMIDDSESEFFLLKELARRHSKNCFDLSWESQIEAALDSLLNNNYDAYIVDYRMGTEDGIELISKARAKGCSKPIILLTGFDGEEVDRMAQKAGADDYLVKDEINFRILEKSIRYAVERRKGEKKIVEQQIKLSQALKMSALGELSSGIAHEINNPLAVISGTVSSLSRGLEREALEANRLLESLKKIEKMTFRIAKIVRSLQNYSRNSDLDPFERYSLKEIVGEAVELCMSKVRSAGVRIDVRTVESNLDVNCRPGELVRVIVNLISNAVDAVGNMEKPWIRVHYCVEEGNCYLKVTDSGSGISEEVQQNILIPYFSTKKRGLGTGLGLNICKMIIDSHSGEFYLSEDSSNTQFVVKLPFLSSNEPTKV